jgi:WS/DGAT/MGAT family acyltransferase
MDVKGPDSHQRLSGTDAAFLYLERKEIPLHIACVCIFEEAIPYEEFLAAIDSKLHLLPRYRQLAVNPPFGIGYPNWEYDQHFDIRRHIIRITVNAPGDDDALEDLAGRLFSVVMSREKPLWEIYVVEGLQGGRGALIVKVHHALADGIAGASMLRIMLDPTPEGSHAIRKPQFQPPAPSREPSLTDAIASAIHSSLENLVAAEAGLLDIAQGLLSERSQQGLQGLVKLLPEIVTPVQRLPFNKQCGSERKFCWAEFDFADVKAIRNVTGGTVNDVILTVVTRALARYVKLHGESSAGRLLRMVCPVSVRKEEQGEALGNRISFLPVTLPMEAGDPVEHLHEIALRTAIMKSAQAAELLAIAASWLGAAPPQAQALFWWGIPLVPLPAPLLNLICTNVPGSPTPLYSVGKRMLASYPHVPTGYELGVGIAVQSYNGKMCFGLTADAMAAPDVRSLRDFIGTSWAELCRAAGIRPEPQRSAAPKTTTKPKVKARARKAPRVAVLKTAAAAPSPVAASPLPATEPEPQRSAAPKTKPKAKSRAPKAPRVAVLEPAAAAPSPVAASPIPAAEPEPVKEFAPAVQEEVLEFA